MFDVVIEFSDQFHQTVRITFYKMVQQENIHSQLKCKPGLSKERLFFNKVLCTYPTIYSVSRRKHVIFITDSHFLECLYLHLKNSLLKKE